jgi:hypothetical protein
MHGLLTEDGRYGRQHTTSSTPRKEGSAMFTRYLSALIAAGVLFLGIASLATAEEKGKTIRSQEQVRTNEQHETRVQAGDPAENAVGDASMTQDRTQTKDRLRDGTGDHDPDRLRDRDYDRDQLHDRDRDRLGTGSGGTGSGMRGTRR